METMDRLLSIVFRKNIINLSDNIIIPNNQQILSLTENKENELYIKLHNLIQNFNSNLTEDTNDMRDIKNFLHKEIQGMNAYIIDFVKSNSNNLKKSNKFDENFNNIFSILSNKSNILDEEDVSVFKTMSFMKNVVNYISIIFPNIIIHKLDYENINIPDHWKLSEKHVNDMQNIVHQYYVSFNEFYEQQDMIELLKRLV